MMKKIFQISCLLLVALFALQANAAQWGLALSYINSKPLNSGNPRDVYGFAGAVTLQPQSTRWKYLDLFFSGDYSYWRASGAVENANLHTVTIAPVLRLIPNRDWRVWPYLEGSVGVSYLSDKMFEDRDLGSQFSFKDLVGVGAAFGSRHQYNLSWQLVHYSNAGISSQNSGFTVPLIITFGYWFNMQ